MLFKKKRDLSIYSPFEAEIIPLINVPDPVFSQKLMGDGIGFILSKDEIYMPFSGTINQVFPTKHAIGITTDSGIDALLHIGLETVELQGKGFDIHAKPGDKLKSGSLLGFVDLNFIDISGKEIISVLVFPENKNEIIIQTYGKVKGTEKIASFFN
ncbi:PTS sugar transporter subunit IIA [Listeria ivanovii]|uniref:PTS sugar transporter subunit IIA n=1 Tax=Listeria ivanovii TaxID=1638 RepID=UPI00065DDA2A|nr:PTS glucose transporter subunit IIA [Listeria ivanovii]